MFTKFVTKFVTKHPGAPIWGERKKKRIFLAISIRLQGRGNIHSHGLPRSDVELGLLEEEAKKTGGRYKMFLGTMDGLKAGVDAMGKKLAATATLNRSRQRMS